MAIVVGDAKISEPATDYVADTHEYLDMNIWRLAPILIATGLFIICIGHAEADQSGRQVADKPVECADKLNPSLKTLLGKVFPELHVPLAAELDLNAVQYDRHQGGDGCYVVAAGDFIGAGRQSVAMILAAVKGKQGRLVVAVNTSSGWRFDQLPTYCGDVFSCYVKVEKPGTFVRTLAVDGRVQTNGELEEMTTKTDAVISGKLESTGVVFAYNKGHWIHVWVSD